jgi:hypothetical protein
VSDADIKANILGMIAAEFGCRQVSNEFYVQEFEDHEEPAVLLDVFRNKEIGHPRRKPVFRVRIDVTVTRTEET